MEYADNSELLSGGLKLYRCSFRHALYPWRQRGLLTPYWRFYRNFSEGGVLIVNDKRILLHPGRYYLIPRGFSFSTDAEQPFDHFYLHFNLDARTRQAETLYEFPADSEVDSWIHRCIEYGKKSDTLLLRTLLCYRILSTVLAQLPPDTFLPVRRVDARIENVCRLLETHFERCYSNRELAYCVHLTCNSFLRLFQQETGESPQYYRRRKAIEFAAEELFFSSKSIEEIAAEAGFADRGHFAKTFKRFMNLAPAAYRKVHSALE